MSSSTNTSDSLAVRSTKWSTIAHYLLFLSFCGSLRAVALWQSFCFIIQFSRCINFAAKAFIYVSNANVWNTTPSCTHPCLSLTECVSCFHFSLSHWNRFDSLPTTTTIVTCEPMLCRCCGWAKWELVTVNRKMEHSNIVWRTKKKELNIDAYSTCFLFETNRMTCNTQRNDFVATNNSLNFDEHIYCHTSSHRRTFLFRFWYSAFIAAMWIDFCASHRHNSEMKFKYSPLFVPNIDTVNAIRNV